MGGASGQDTTENRTRPKGGEVEISDSIPLDAFEAWKRVE